MATDFKLPNLGEGVEAGDVVSVSAKPGDHVERGQSLLEVETNKAVLDVGAPEDGVVAQVLVNAGDKVRPGQVMLTYQPAAAAAKASIPPGALAPAAPSTFLASTAPPTPALKPSNPALPSEALAASAPWPRDGKPAPASPSLRKFARELGVDLHQVTGSGPRGRILEQDVKAFVKRRMQTGPAVHEAGQPSLPNFSRFGLVERQPLKGVRKATASGLARSWPLVPQVTQFDIADITGVEAARRKFMDGRKDQPGKVTMTVLAAKAVAKALEEFPRFNSSLDLAAGELVLKQYVHLGVAVASEHGLMVPVIRDANRKSLVELALELERLAEKVRSRKIQLEEMQGGCFTISNLGGIGGVGFTPIVNWPEVAILGLARAHEDYVLKDGKASVRLRMPLSLSYDHRVIDGADGARFLRRVCEILGNPFQLLT